MIYKNLILIIILFTNNLVFSNTTLEGDWMIQIKPDGAEVIGLLQLEQHENNWKAWVEGGPSPVTVNKEKIILDIDIRDIRGFVFIARLEGVIQNDELIGSFSLISDSKVYFTPGTWKGHRYKPNKKSKIPDPVDLSGIWTPAPGVDMRKYSMDLTPAANEWHKDYLTHYDQPNVRCISPGIVAMVAWGAYPFEILEHNDRFTFIYEVDSEVRRIFLNDRTAPEFYPLSGMGYSTASWEGSSLVIETNKLQPNVRDFRGEPISENALMHEEYSLSDDGNTLNSVITLYDPENYNRPPIRRRQWTRNPDTEILPYECDPDSFYRQMYNEGKIDMYFERSKRRF